VVQQDRVARPPLAGGRHDRRRAAAVRQARARNKLVDSAQEGIAIAGFGGATLAAFAGYLSPENARAVLRKGSRGHFCMATQGEVILAAWDRVESRDKLETATDLQSRLPALKAEIDKELAKAEDSRNPKLAEAQAVYERGIRAFALYNRQRDWLRVGPVHLGESAWHFGMSLIEQADREAVDVNALVRTITEQTNSMANFEQASASVPGDAGTKAGGAPAVSPPPLEAEARAVRDDLVVLMADLPNVEAMVLGFDNCAAAALIGGSPRATMIQTLTLD